MLAATALGMLTFARPARADDLVRQIQEELRKRNIYFGDVDGALTPPTIAALRRYQQRKGFPTTGEPDPVTLHSLMIPVPPTLAATAPPGPSPAESVSTPGPLKAASPWPEITVLRSDEARPPDAAHEDDRVGPDTTATPPAPEQLPTPPPHAPAAATKQRLTAEDVRAFVERYLQAGQTNDPPGELAFFGDRVEYFDDGLKDRHYIEQDITRYDHRWPERHFTMLEPFSVSPAPGSEEEKTVVTFRLQFANKNSKYAVQGKTDNTWTIVGTRPEELRIVAIKEQRVRE